METVDESPARVVPTPPDKKKIRHLWKVAGILGLVTALEFAFAFSLPRGSVKTFFFIIMTIIKAAYIVGEFMHLRYEAKVLIWAILLPLLFIVWLIVALLYEGIHLPAMFGS